MVQSRLPDKRTWCRLGGRNYVNHTHSITLRSSIPTHRSKEEASMKTRLWITLAVAMVVGMLIGLLAPTRNGGRHDG